MCDNARECRAAHDRGFDGPVVHAPMPSVPPAADLRSAVLAALAAEPMSAESLALATGGEQGHVAGLLIELRATGKVRSRVAAGRHFPARVWELS